MPALGAEGHPAEVHAGQIVRLQCELDDASGERVVERGDELGKLFRAYALSDELERELANVRARALQCAEVGRVVDAGANLAQADALQ